MIEKKCDSYVFGTTEHKKGIIKNEDINFIHKTFFGVRSFINACQGLLDILSTTLIS